MISDIDLMVMRRRVMIMTKVMIKIDENDPIWQANEAKMKIPKNPERFPWNPGIKNIGKSRPEKSRDPGIWQNPVPKNPGIEILDPVRACSGAWAYFWGHWFTFPFLLLKTIYISSLLFSFSKWVMVIILKLTTCWIHIFMKISNKQNSLMDWQISGMFRLVITNGRVPPLGQIFILFQRKPGSGSNSIWQCGQKS